MQVENKPIIIFTVFMVIAFIVVASFLIFSDPFNTKPKASQQTAQTEMGDQEGMVLYLNNCASCHGLKGKGLNGNPALTQSKLGEEQIAHIIFKGKGKMPAFHRLTFEQIQKLTELVKQF